MADSQASESREFLFGMLSTRDGRVTYERSRRSGLRHAFSIEPRDPKPGEPVTVIVHVGVELAASGIALHYRTVPDGDRPPVRTSAGGFQTIAMQRTRLEWDTLTWGYLERWEAVIPGQPEGTTVIYHLTAETSGGIPIDTAHSTGPRVDLFEFAYHVDRYEIAPWFRDAVVYHVFVDRFAADPGADLDRAGALHRPLGGTLKGLIARIDELADMGFNTLWLTPITPSPDYHGYAPVALDDVEPRLGTLDDWRALVAAARERGVKLILDFVANHVSDQHPAFLVARADRSSPYVSWFRFREWPALYQGFFDLTSMPVLETDNPAVRAHLIEQAKLWLGRGCDGFRLDHAHGPGPGFWSEFRAAIKVEYPDAVLLGEVTEPPDAQRVYSGRMDGLLDFTLAEVLRRTFHAGPEQADHLAVFLSKHLPFFGAELVMASFLDNHDMNRFLWLAGGDARKLRLAALCQFTLPGPPIVYYGTEVGLSQHAPADPLEHARLPMPTEVEYNAPLASFYRELIVLRHAGGQAWRQGPSFEFDARPKELIAYRSGPFRILLNPSEETVETDLRGELVFQTDAHVVDRALGGDLLAPWSGAVVRES